MKETAPPAYEREPYRTTLDVSILEVSDDAGRPYAVLDDTILFPEGGLAQDRFGWQTTAFHRGPEVSDVELEQHVFALGAGEGFGDAQMLGREIASRLGGKGGGAGRVFQGKAPGPLEADRAFAWLKETSGS